MPEKLIATIDAKGGQVVEAFEIYTNDRTDVLRAFEVRSSTGYRATLPEVHWPETCEREICIKSADHGSYEKTRGHCHGLHHAEQVIALARKVAATYGDAGRPETSMNTGWPQVSRDYRHPASGRAGYRVRSMPAREWAETEWAQAMEVMTREDISPAPEPALFEAVA